jgi:cyclopropane fatty-acyl-phospholipid synthase-like methyltransferase
MSDYSVTFNYYRTMSEEALCRDQFLPANSESEYNITGRNDCRLIIEAYKKRSDNPLLNVLDFGCGDGRVARFLAKECVNMTCVDVSIPVLKAVEKKMQYHKNENVTYIEANGFDDEDKYDLIYSLQVIQHNPYEEQIGIVNQIKKALTKDGWALLHLPKLENKPDYKNVSTCMCFTLDQVEHIASHFSKWEFDDRTTLNDYEDYYLWVQK